MAIGALLKINSRREHGSLYHEVENLYHTSSAIELELQGQSSPDRTRTNHSQQHMAEVLVFAAGTRGTV